MKKRRSNLVLKIMFLSLAVAVFFFTAAYLAFPALFFSTPNEKKGGAAAAEKFETGRVNIVLLGFDRDEIRGKKSQAFRPDTIMIASLNFKSNEVSLVSIPRDSYVKIAGTDINDKINHSYMYGYNLPGVTDAHQSGIDTTIRTVEDFLGGIPIHYYVTVDMDGVCEVVDRVGGVYFDVKYPVRSDYGRGYLMLDQGYQLLDGKKFLIFVRDRSVGGDFGRAARQQEILIEAFRQVKERGKLKDIPAFYRSVKNNVETNLSVTKMAQLAVFGLKIKPDMITTHVFPGSIQYAPRNGLDISYVVINEQSRVEIIKEVFGVVVPARPQITLPGPSHRPVQQPQPYEVQPSDEYNAPVDDEPGPPLDEEPETPADDESGPPGDEDPPPPGGTDPPQEKEPIDDGNGPSGGDNPDE